MTRGSNIGRTAGVIIEFVVLAPRHECFSVLLYTGNKRVKGTCNREIA